MRRNVSGEDRMAAELVALPLGQRVARLRRRRGMSQVQLAELCGWTMSYISQIERGRVVNNLGTITALAEVLGVDRTLLVEGMALFQPDLARQEAIKRDVDHALSLEEVVRVGAMATEIPIVSQDQIDDLIGRGRYAAVGELLMKVAEQAAAIARRSQGEVELLLVRQIFTRTAAAMAQAGEPALAWQAIERCLTLATEQGDVELAAELLVEIGIAFLGLGMDRDAERAGRRGVGLVEAVTPAPPPSVAILHGELWLVEAVAATRLGWGQDAEEAVNAAERIIGSLGGDAQDPRLLLLANMASQLGII